MSTHQIKSPIVDAHIRVARDHSLATKRLHIWITLLLTVENVTIAPFDKEKDLFNVKASGNNGNTIGTLNFNVHLQPTSNELQPVKTPITLSKVYEFNNEEGGNADFKFDETENFILLTNIDASQILGPRPEGTKRTVITYEDTDVIDDTIL